jgi:capsular polysaccharide transport system permease protein
MSLSRIDVQEPAHFWRGLIVQRRVLHALMVRELMMRYGRGNIGFLWIVLEPMILCAGVIGLRWLIQGHQEHGLSLVAILLSGYMPLTLWRHLTNRGVFLLRRNIGLLYHRSVTLLDTVLMTMFLEFAGCTVAFLLNYFALLEIGAIGPINNYGLVASAWLSMGALGFSFGVLIAVLTEYYEAAERFIQPVQYLIVPLSGFFFMVDWLPREAQDLAWYMPIIHCFEMIRAGFFGASVITHYDVWYPLAWSLGVLAIAFPMIEKARSRIHYG